MPGKHCVDLFFGFNGNPHPRIPEQIKRTHVAKRVEGGYELSGRSKWNSGIMQADRVLTAIAIEGEVPKLALVKGGEDEVDVVWDISAIEGTGSNDMIRERTIVPDHGIIELPGVVDRRTEGDHRSTNPFCLMLVWSFMYSEDIRDALLIPGRARPPRSASQRSSSPALMSGVARRPVSGWFQLLRINRQRANALARGRVNGVAQGRYGRRQ